MLIDKLSWSAPLEHFEPDDQRRLRLSTERTQRFDPATGEIKSESGLWTSIRSDAGGIGFKVCSDRVLVNGSPARVIGDGDAVFGAGPALALDLVGCWRAQAAALGQALGVRLPPYQVCRAIAIDVTGNLFLPSPGDVKAALAILGQTNASRLRVSYTKGDSVYWNTTSRLKSGKAYHKGPHLRKMMKDRDHCGRRYNQEEIAIGDHLLRLECSIKGQELRERIGKNWYELTPQELRVYWQAMFLDKLGAAEVTEMGIEQRVYDTAPSEGQARAAMNTWALIKMMGFEQAKVKASTTRTFQRHLKILRAAGLSDADFSAGRVVEFRRPLIEYQLVDSWGAARDALNDYGRQAA